MTSNYLTYEQHPDGYVDHWLLANTYAHWVKDLDKYPGPDFKLLIAQAYHRQESDVAGEPVEGGSLTHDGQALAWQAVRCPDDHMIDISVFHHNCHYLCAWAYAIIDSDVAGPVTLTLGTNGPADLWLNGKHVHRQEHFHHQDPLRVPFAATLVQGRNAILVRFEEVAARECPFTMSLRVNGAPAETLRILLPAGPIDTARRQAYEKLVWAVFCDRELYTGDAPVVARWEDATGVPDGKLRFALLDQTEKSVAQAQAAAAPSGSVELIHSSLLADGEYRLVIVPAEDVAVRAEIALQVMKYPYAEKPYGTLSERRSEALQAAAGSGEDVFAEIAKMELGRWADVKQSVVLETIEGINNRRDCSDFFLCGLLGMIYRYGGDPAFPAGLKAPLEACIVNFKYWLDEPGEDVMCYETENHSILFHACEILAGQLYPQRVFSNCGQPGRWHIEKGHRLARAWFDMRGKYGFHEWDSNTYFEEDLLALTHICDLATDKTIALLAEMAIDKMLFTMAVNSHRGVFGSTHGRTYTPYIKGARLEGTTGFGRLLWGQGVFNTRILGMVAAATSRRYHLPAAIERIASELPEEMLSREHHDPEWDLSKMTYKTPDYMLCSAQDWNPGQLGYQQHIWQATLGMDAVVFSTHPPSMSEDNSRRPNYWHGNYILPRVAQVKDLLIAIYHLPDDDRMGLTHAYFPMYAFAESALAGGWAFARRGDGYLAITARQGISLTRRGKNAYRELRSPGLRNVWLCQMGRAASDGSFAQFQARVLALQVAWSDLGVRLTSLRGQTVSFGWTGPLSVDGEPWSLPFPHIDNPYCQAEWEAGRMTIRAGDESISLDFSTPQKLVEQGAPPVAMPA